MNILSVILLFGLGLVFVTNAASIPNAGDVPTFSVPSHPPVNPGAYGIEAPPLPSSVKHDQEQGFSTVAAKQKRDVVTLPPGPIHDIHHEPGQDVDKVTSPSHATAVPQVVQTALQNGPRVARQSDKEPVPAVGRRPYSNTVEHHTILDGAEIIVDTKDFVGHTIGPDHPYFKDEVSTAYPLNITLRSMIRERRDVTVKESPQYKESNDTVTGVTEVPRSKREIDLTNLADGPVVGNVGSVSSGSALQDVKGNPIVMSGPLLVDPSQLTVLTTQSPALAQSAAETTVAHVISQENITPRSKREIDVIATAAGPIQGNVGAVSGGSALVDVKGNPIVMSGPLLVDASQLHVLSTPQASLSVSDATVNVTPASDASVVTTGFVNVDSTVGARRRRDVTTPSTGPVVGNIGSVASGSALQDVKGNPIVMQGSLLTDESQLSVLFTSPQPSSAQRAVVTIGMTSVDTTQSSAETQTAVVQAGDVQLPSTETSTTAVSAVQDTTKVITVIVPVEVRISAATVAPAVRKRRTPDETLDAPVVKASEFSAPPLVAAYEAVNATDVPQTAQLALVGVVVDSARGSEVVKVKRDIDDTGTKGSVVVAAMDGSAAAISQQGTSTNEDSAKTHGTTGAADSSSAHSTKVIDLNTADASTITGDHTLSPITGTSSQHPTA